MPLNWKKYKDTRYLYFNVKEIFENSERDADDWGVNAAPAAHSILQLLDCRGATPSPGVANFIKGRIVREYIRKTALVGLAAGLRERIAISFASKPRDIELFQRSC